MENLKAAFDEVAENYDKQRRSLIPCFDDFYGTITNLATSQKNDPIILDIGAGTGLVSDFLFKKFPKASFTLIDISDEMLILAKHRFKHNSNFKFVAGDYRIFQYSEKYDIVVSGLSIHHLEDLEKKALYARIFNILNSTGIFINGDQFLLRSKNAERNYQKAWKDKIEESGLTDNEKKAAYNRMLLDKPATIENNLQWLDDAGFSDTEIYYKYYNFAVISGIKNDLALSKKM